MHHFVLLLLLAGPVPGWVATSGDDAQSTPAVVRTGKERLGVKAADEQRVDDCKVPPALRTPHQADGVPRSVAVASAAALLCSCCWRMLGNLITGQYENRAPRPRRTLPKGVGPNEPEGGREFPRWGGATAAPRLSALGRAGGQRRTWFSLPEHVIDGMAPPCPYAARRPGRRCALTGGR